MLTVNKHSDILVREFYLDSDGITVRRNTDGWRDKWKKHDRVIGYKLCKYGYKGVHIPRTRTTVPMSHLLTFLRGITIPDNCITDHLNGDSYDNEVGNIRVTSQKLNCRNKRKHSNNTSGYTGISWNKKANCFITRKYLDGVRVYGGSAKTLEEAKELMKALNLKAKSDGYTTRHGI